MHQATLYKKLLGRKVRCNACRHNCTIAKGSSGICGVRQNQDGVLQLLVYGRAAGVGIDPVEKKPLFHFLPGKKIFSFGTIGCNFGCQFCQNWDTSQASREFRKQALAGKLGVKDFQLKVSQYGFELNPAQIIAYCLEHQLPAIAYTYNEPAIFFEYAYDTAKLAKEAGIKNVFVSNGYSSRESLEILSKEGLLDAANIDLKSFNEEFYRKLCQARLQPVLDCIKDYVRLGIWLELTTLIIPGKNDSEAELRQIAAFIAALDKDIPWHISRFSPSYQMLTVPETSQKALDRAYEIGKEAGLRYVYVGNVFDAHRQSTYCPECQNILVERDWDHIELRGLLASGKCRQCGAKIPGIW